MDDLAIARVPTAIEITGRGRSSLYNDIEAGLLTRPVAVGGNAKGWPVGELRAINRARIAGKTEADIRALVEQLHEARKALA